MQLVKLKKNGLLFILLMTSVNLFALNLNEKHKGINFSTVELPLCNIDSEKDLRLPEDPRAELYYQAAMKILGQNDTEHYSQMYILANKSAEMGHWKAKLLSANLYSKNSDSHFSDYQPKKAKEYIDDLLEQNVPAAFYAMGQYKLNGTEVFRDSPIPASVFLFEAAKLNNPDALTDIHDILISIGRVKDAQVMLDCAIQRKQGVAGALLKKANELELSATTEVALAESFKYLYLATKAGNYNALASFENKENYYKQQYGKAFFGKEFLERMSVLQKAKNSIYIHRDPYRKALGRNEEVRGNSNLAFPDLEKIAPFPPAELPNWDRDISIALSEEDLKIYRTDFDYDQLVKEAEAIVIEKNEPVSTDKPNAVYTK